MTRLKISRPVLIAILFVGARPASAADGDANLETARYLLRASEAHEQAAASSRGRMRATFITKTIPVGSKYENDIETLVDCVWDGGRSLRTVHETNHLMSRKHRKIAGSENASPNSVRYRILITPERMCEVRDPDDGDKRKPYVRDWPYLNMPDLVRNWRVLPYEGSSQYLFQHSVSGMLRIFIDSPLEPERPERVISEKGDSVILKEQYSGGGRIEFTFSRAWGDRMVAYTSIPGGKMVTMDFSGSLTWNRDPHGEIYLQAHTFETRDNREEGTIRTTWKLTIEEYDSQPVIGSDELTFEGLKLPDDAPLTTFGNEPRVPIATTTVGGQPVKTDNKELDKLVEQLKTRGFARPERTK